MIHHLSRPNVLVVITDQQRGDAVGYETPWVQTPHLDGLATTATVCTSAYVQSPQCQPSRASIFTGRYPTAHRVWWNGVSLPKAEKTIGNYLQDAGYRTGYFGKMHFGGDTAVARHFGFQESFLYEDWAGSFTQHFQTGRTGRTEVEKEFQEPMSTKTWTGRFATKELHHEEVVTEHAVSFVKRTSPPFLCVVGYHGPHPPYASPDEFSGLYRPELMTTPTNKIANRRRDALSDDEWRALKVQYYGAVSWIDSCVGRLLAAVGHNTIVVFTSDHGDILGDHGLFSKGMFAYEGNIRVPLVVRLPAVKPGPYKHLVQSIDILPTILEACAVAVPRGVQGQSLVKAFRTGEMINDMVLSMIGHSIRLRMVRTHRHKYWICGDDEYLFDLKNDPHEVNRSSRPDYLAQLRLLLLRGLIRAEDPLPQPV